MSTRNPHPSNIFFPKRVPEEFSQIKNVVHAKCLLGADKIPFHVEEKLKTRWWNQNDVRLCPFIKTSLMLSRASFSPKRTPWRAKTTTTERQARKEKQCPGEWWIVPSLIVSSHGTLLLLYMMIETVALGWALGSGNVSLRCLTNKPLKSSTTTLLWHCLVLSHC